MKIFAGWLLLFNSFNLFSQNSHIGSPPDEYLIHIETTNEKILIDGDLKERIWEEAKPVSGFWMCYPEENIKIDQTYQTEVRMAHDDHNIYLGVTCYGSDQYIIQTLRRDKDIPRGDGFGVVIDPVNEKTNGFVFMVNPVGVQTELLISGRTGRRNGEGPEGTNIAWDNKWFTEVKNYPDRWTIEIAIPLKTLRYKDNIKNWGINFFRFDAQNNNVQSWTRLPVEFWEIDLGYTGTLAWDKAPKKAKSNISVIPYTLGSVTDDFEGDNSDPEYDLQAGVDAKVALTSSLNFDLTLNPDFSQVEVDEQVTNLTLFDISLPEQRLFFLENSDIFEDFGIPPMRPFFSRKIGLDEEGNPIPILFGARLSGNVNNDLRIGLMNMQTKATDDFKGQNYTAFAFHQQLFSRSVIKGYFHNRSALKVSDPDYNRNAGLEFQYRSSDGRVLAFGGGGNSFSPGLKSESYFYNVGAGYDNKNISAYTNVAGIGSNYKADMGFIQGQEYYDAVRDTIIRIGYHHWFSRFSYTFYPKSAGIISHVIGGEYILDVDTAFSQLNNDTGILYSLNFANTSVLGASYRHTRINLLYPFSFIDQEPLPAGIYQYDYGEIKYDSDQRKRFIVNAGLTYGSFYNGTWTRYIAGVKYRAQPWGNFSVNYEQNDLRFPKPYGEDNLILLSSRIEINFSRSVFWTTFFQYITQLDNFNINSRLQWRFLPMSDVYLVYTDNYSVDFWGPKNRALVLKVNYWLNF